MVAHGSAAGGGSAAVFTRAETYERPRAAGTPSRVISASRSQLPDHRAATTSAAVHTLDAHLGFTPRTLSSHLANHEQSAFSAEYET